jgi:hypothetical protein
MAAKHATLFDQEIIIKGNILLLNMQIVKWGQLRYGPLHFLPLLLTKKIDYAVLCASIV